MASWRFAFKAWRGANYEGKTKKLANITFASSMTIMYYNKNKNSILIFNWLLMQLHCFLCEMFEYLSGCLNTGDVTRGSFLQTDKPCHDPCGC